MLQARPSPLSRRALLGFGLGGALLAACGRPDRPRSAVLSPPLPPPRPPAPGLPLAPTPAADDGDGMPPVRGTCAPTEDNIEGPFFKPGAPHRNVLVTPGDPGEYLAITGVVMSTNCQPIPGADLDIWHADHRGAYDNEGFRHRGRLCTRHDGAFELVTIVPGRYLNGRRYRPAHIHVKLSAPGHTPLTTQLYFAGDPYNQGDDFIRPSLILQPLRAGALSIARFDFVLAS